MEAIVLCAVLTATSTSLSSPVVAEEIPPDLRERAVATLRDSLHEQSRWLKVHAAEFLLDLSYPNGVEQEFRKELRVNGHEPEYRIGIWRVLSRAAATSEHRDEFADKIITAARDANGPDRLHAVEALAKLGVQVGAAARRDIHAWTEEAADGEAAFAHWYLARSRDGAAKAEHLRQLESLLSSDEPLARLRAAYALSRMPELARESWLALSEAADQAAGRETDDSLELLADAHVLIAAWKVAGHTGQAESRVSAYRREVQQRAGANATVARAYVDALATLGTSADVSFLASQLATADADLRASAAHALLRIDRRRAHVLAPIDWIVIAAYGLSMLGIGVFYSRRSKSADDFLLGGRTMSPWMVGVSLFATLLSTLTYLAVPGEMIKHGPMILAGIASFPLVAWIVGWSMIPFFMRLKATTAYEILETRFGYRARVLGSIMFLALRLFWMAVIVYKTTEIVLMPLFGLPPSDTKWVCAVVGVITVIYSSMGGLRAVVVTDVVQSAILLGGAVLTLFVITAGLGGVGQWWPREWDPNWAPLKWGFDPGSTRTVSAAVLAYFVWFICTSGSDQMAVQRYLATKDAAAARRMFILSLAVNAFSTVALGIVGFALLAWYREHPEMLPDHATVASHSDMLFTHFIVAGLPAGVSGIAIAGLLAAAMSSLSSGINSSCSTISVDYVIRWRGEQSDRATLRQTIVISWIVGAVIVLLSTLVGYVEGNLLDVIQKVVNLLVAPLFVLFFMAMYVKRASWPAALVAVVASIAAAAAVAFFEIGGLSVLWIMPVSLAAGVASGWLASVCFNRDHPA